MLQSNSDPYPLKASFAPLRLEGRKGGRLSCKFGAFFAKVRKLSNGTKQKMVVRAICARPLAGLFVENAQLCATCEIGAGVRVGGQYLHN